MGYHDIEAQVQLQMFLVAADGESEVYVQPASAADAEGRGTPIHDLTDLEAVHDDLQSRIVVQLQYDRFAPGIHRRRGH